MGPKSVQLLLSAAILLSATTAPVQAADQITIRDFAFSPMILRVAAGTTVTWRNSDGEPHTVVSLDGGFRSPALDQNDSFSFRFARPGIYKYICSIHPQMTGTINVR